MFSIFENVVLLVVFSLCSNLYEWNICAGRARLQFPFYFLQIEILDLINRVIKKHKYAEVVGLNNYETYYI